MLEETLDDPPLNVSYHVTSAAAAVPPYDDRSPYTTQQASRAL